MDLDIIKRLLKTKEKKMTSFFFFFLPLWRTPRVKFPYNLARPAKNGHPYKNENLKWLYDANIGDI